MKNIALKISIIIMTVVMVLVGFTSIMGSIDSYAAIKKSDKVKITSAVVKKNTVTVKWKKAKGAKYYQVAIRSNKKAWVKKKTVKNTAANKKKYTKKNVYKVKKTGKKLAVYKYEYKYTIKKKKVTKLTYKFANLKYNTKYAFAVRSSNGQEFSPWITITRKTKAKSTRYNYDVKFFNQPYSGILTGVFVQTNNPDQDNFEVIYCKPNGTEIGTSSLMGDVMDLPLTEEEIKYNVIPQTYTVKGGYATLTGINDPGEVTVIVREYPKGKTWVDYHYGRCTCITKTIGKITVKDSSAELKKWMENIISKTTNSSMTKKEKMQSITNYLYDISKYWKNYNDKNGQMQYLTLIVDHGVPAWVSNEWDSYDSPALLCEFGEMIGYPLHNMYGDYSYGSPEWSMYHWYAKSEEDGTLYGFCRTPDTNAYEDIHSRDDVKKVDCLKYNKYYTCH